MGLPAEVIFESAPEAFEGGSLLALLSQPETLVGLFGIALAISYYSGKRDTNVSLRQGLLSDPFKDLDLRKVSDRRRYFPSPSSQDDLGFNLDGTPVNGVVPLEDFISRPATWSPAIRRPGRRAQPAPNLGRASFRYDYAYADPRNVVDCVRRARRRSVLFSRGRLRNRGRKHYRPGAFSCYGW